MATISRPWLSRLDRSLIALGGLPPSLDSQPHKPVCAHLLPWQRIPSGGHTVHRKGWTGPSVAGFFQVQGWFLNVAAPSLRKRYQLPQGGLLAAFHLSLPHTQTTGCGTLGAKKGGVSMQSSPVMSAEQLSSNLRTYPPREIKRAGRMARILKTGHRVHHAPGEKTKDQRI